MATKPWRLCDAGKQLKQEIDALYPKRDKTSDGTIGDTLHSARLSQHNPDSSGVVYAIDIDEDLYGVGKPDPFEANLLVKRLVDAGRRDARIWYIIFEGNIWSRTGDWVKRPYRGSNKHNHHVHVSFTSLGNHNGKTFRLERSAVAQSATVKNTAAKKV
jgi:hypothetical protein